MAPATSGQTLRKPGFSQRSASRKIPRPRTDAEIDESSKLGDDAVGPSNLLRGSDLQDDGKLEDVSGARSTVSGVVPEVHVRPLAVGRSAIGKLQLGSKAEARSENASNHSTLPLPAHPSRSASVRVARTAPKESGIRKDLSRAASTVIPRAKSGTTRPTIPSGKQTRDDELHGVRSQHQQDRSSPEDQLTRARERTSHETTQAPAGKHLPVTRLQPSARPQFSTYQQHFSPKKADAAPSSRGISATSKLDSTKSESSHLSSLQDELLQVQWLYHKSLGVSEEWAESARKKLGQRQACLEEEARRIQSIKDDQQHRVNVDALRKWSVDNVGQMDPSKIETLDRCIRRLTEMARSHGKYADVIAQFEGWFAQAKTVLEERSAHPKHTGHGISRLGPSWRNAIPTLMHTLESCLADLAVIEPSGIDASTGLCAVWTAHQTLARGMISELQTMVEVYGSVLAVDEQWIRGSIATIVDGGLESSSGRPHGGQAWD